MLKGVSINTFTKLESKMVSRDDDYGVEMCVHDTFFIGCMPKKNRTKLKRLTSSSYRAMINAKEVTAMTRYFGRMSMLSV